MYEREINNIDIKKNIYDKCVRKSSREYITDIEKEQNSAYM